MTTPELAEKSGDTGAVVESLPKWIEEQVRLQFAKHVFQATPDELFRAAAGAIRP